MPMFGRNKKDKKEKTGQDSSPDVGNVDDSSLENDEDDDDNGIDDLLGNADEDGSSGEGSGEDEDGNDALAGIGMDDDDDDDGIDSDLMDIFSSEAEEADIDLAALTSGLEPVDASSLLIQAQSVVAALRRKLYG